MTYTPQPLDTSAVALPPSIEKLVERLAEHNHDVWARARIAEGWAFGPRRDDDLKEHPGLVPYSELSESEREYDRNTAREVLRAILAFGFAIEKAA